MTSMPKFEQDHANAANTIQNYIDGKVDVRNMDNRMELRNAFILAESWLGRMQSKISPDEIDLIIATRDKYIAWGRETGLDKYKVSSLFVG